jgi:hypothetical protein
VSRSRRSILVALLVTILGAMAMPGLPAHAADKNPDLSVGIRSLNPSRLSPGATVTMSGTVTNNDDHAWTNVQAYLVIPASPFTTRAQVEQAIQDGSSYTGVRVVDQGTYYELGDLAPQATRSFRVTVPYDKLGVSGAEGVYPVGVQILGTDTDGGRSQDAIARATTFLPMISSTEAPVPASVVWPFLMPDYRGADGRYTDPASLLAAVSTGGRLRNLLDLASHSGHAATVLIDPALLVGVDDLANGRHLPHAFKLTELQQTEAELFLQDLLRFARAESCWVLDFDRPDDLALAQNPDLSPPLSAAIETATEAALTKFQLSGRRASWPTENGVTSGLLQDARGAGDAPAIVTPGAVPGWDRRQGSLVKYATAAGPIPLFVNDVLDGDVPGQDSVVTLRQRILSEAALAVLQRAIDAESKADAVTMVDPRWNPGRQWAAGKLSAAFDAPFTTGTTLDGLLTRPLSTYDGKIPRTAKDKPLSRIQLAAAADIVAKGRALSSVIPQSSAVDEELSGEVGNVLGVRWRADAATGIAIARARAEQAGAELRKIKIEGPPSVTLSSSKGRFPLTITNGTGEAIRVGVSLDSSNPALRVPDVKPIDIGAGDRHTLTVDIDLGRQNTTTLTARLTSPDGKEIGDPSKDFNVRSSKVGIVLWIAMGLAGLLVLAALVRRFRRQRTRVSSQQAADDDD